MTELEVEVLNLCTGKPLEFVAEFGSIIPKLISHISKHALENQWVKFDKPELFEDDESECLISKEVFFQLSNSSGTYHGWYLARPIDKSDQFFYENEHDSDDIEYEYFFNANVGDELFDEDHISRWMYVPSPEETGESESE